MKIILNRPLEFLLILSSVFLLAGALQIALGGNRIYWQTASQMDLAGFNIARAESREGPYRVINERILPVTGSRVSGNRYEFLDRDVRSGKIYYYWIEILHLDQSSEKLEVIELKADPTGKIFLGVGGGLAFFWVIAFLLQKRRRDPATSGGV